MSCLWMSVCCSLFPENGSRHWKNQPTPPRAETAMTVIPRTPHQFLRTNGEYPGLDYHAARSSSKPMPESEIKNQGSGGRPPSPSPPNVRESPVVCFLQRHLLNMTNLVRLEKLGHNAWDKQLSIRVASSPVLKGVAKSYSYAAKAFPWSG